MRWPLEMARRGHALGLTARRMALLEQFRDELHAAHGKKLRVELATLDVCQSASVGPTLHELFDRLGGIDTIVVNAGANDITRIGGGDLEKELNLIQTNLAGAIATINAATEHFLERGKGHIVGISSLASLQPIATQAAYCASKAGFSMYLEVGARRAPAQGHRGHRHPARLHQDRHRRGCRHREAALRDSGRAGGTRDGQADRQAREVGRGARLSVEAGAAVPRTSPRALRASLGADRGAARASQKAAERWLRGRHKAKGPGGSRGRVLDNLVANQGLEPRTKGL